jgi:hypothetical protein
LGIKDIIWLNHCDPSLKLQSIISEDLTVFLIAPASPNKFLLAILSFL